MSNEMKQLFNLIQKIGLHQLITFDDGTVNISANGAAILANFDGAKVDRDSQYGIAKVTVQVDDVTVWGYVTDNDYIKYLESKVA